MFGANLGEDLRMLREEMVGTNSAGGSSIVPSEDEELNLCHRKISEVAIDTCS